METVAVKVKSKIFLDDTVGGAFREHLAGTKKFLVVKTSPNTSHGQCHSRAVQLNSKSREGAHVTQS